MSNYAIKVQGVSKKYLIRHQAKTAANYISLREVVTDAAKSFGRKLLRSSDAAADQAQVEEFWALKDINFEIQPGECVGFVGRNGAGKSTLLKVLSRITEPTTGRIRIRGRVGSLLEVGTGFHPELTGRENIFLNGAILGMSRVEIKKRFDEIVAFAEVEQFLDTPVKRYSSGMYMRLAFAVAAHLDPEILIVDEVLAVGDADFQKKCLGRMHDVSSKEGRTVLFVSHNMAAVKSLCDKAVLLRKGTIVEIGDVDHVINGYLNMEATDVRCQVWESPATAPGNEHVRVKKIELIPDLANPLDPIDVRTPLKIRFECWNQKPNVALNLSLHLYSLKGDCVFNIGTPSVNADQGLWVGECTIPAHFLNDGIYTVSVMIVKDTSVALFTLAQGLTFEVKDYRENTAWFGTWLGAVRPTFIPFTLTKAETDSL